MNNVKTKSSEEHAEEVWDSYSEYIDDTLSSMDSIAGSSVIASRYKFLRAAVDIAAPLKSRIEELEEKNKELIKALIGAVYVAKAYDRGKYKKPIEFADEVLNKE